LPPISLFVVDDHALFREGLLRLLESDPQIQIVGSASSVPSSLEQLQSLQVDVLIVDYDLGTETAVSLLRQLRANGFSGRVLVVTAGLPNADAVELIKLGVSGFFLKKDPPEALHRNIREVAAGKVLIDQSYLQLLVASASDDKEGSIRLTERDRQVIRGVLEGLSNKEIAGNLAISETAVKASLQQVFAKTGVRTRSQLVRVALEQLRAEL
jgi:two-component system, NarL family, nitrate/nitrite response regulator NarL